ncbi:MAG: type 1 glutamine amidotransferase [Ktedonobacteraceae bacterium]
MKRVLAILNIEDDSTGYVGELLEEHGIACDVVNAVLEPIPHPTSYDAIVVFGGPQNANEDDRYPYFIQERAALRKAVEQEIPLLGICLGGQLLAAILGGTVKKHTLTEIGFSEVQCTDDGKNDPLYAGLAGHQMVYQWHEDTFAIPPGAVRIATSEKTENQAFRYGHNAYGIQYHIELTPAMLDTWLHEPSLKEEIMHALGDNEYERIMNERPQYYALYREHTRVMFENFLRIARLL